MTERQSLTDVHHQEVTFGSPPELCEVNQMHNNLPAQAKGPHKDQMIN